jgi:hypothetical protein
MAAIVVFVTVGGSIHSSEQTGIATMGRSNSCSNSCSNIICVAKRLHLGYVIEVYPKT